MNTNFLSGTEINDSTHKQETDSKPSPGLMLVVGEYNSIHAHNVVQVNGDTLKAIASNLQTLPPETVRELSGPLTDLVRAMGVLLSKVNDR